MTITLTDKEAWLIVMLLLAELNRFSPEDAEFISTQALLQKFKDQE